MQQHGFAGIDPGRTVAVAVDEDDPSLPPAVAVTATGAAIRRRADDGIAAALGGLGAGEVNSVNEAVEYAGAVLISQQVAEKGHGGGGDDRGD